MFKKDFFQAPRGVGGGAVLILTWLISSLFAVMLGTGCRIFTAVSHPEIVECHKDDTACTGMTAGTEAVSFRFLTSQGVLLDT